MHTLWKHPSLYLPPTASASHPSSHGPSAPKPPRTSCQGNHDEQDNSEAPLPEAEQDSDASTGLSRLFQRHYWHTELGFASSFFGHSHPNPGSSKAPQKTGRPRILYSADTFYDHGVNEIVPEVLVIGCSNVGKSTLLNAVLGCEGLARMSPSAGCTRLVNAYGTGPPAQSMNLFTPDTRQALERMSRGPKSPARREQDVALQNSLIILDTPGYGHSSVLKWGRHIDMFIAKRRQLKGVVLLLRGDLPDVAPTRHDAVVLRMLASARVPFRVVLTRLDRAGGMWPLAAVQIAAKVRAVLGYKEAHSVASWGTDRHGRPLWDGGIWATAAGIDRKRFRKGSEEWADLGVTGVRAAILDMAGLGVFKDGGKRRIVVPDAAPVRTQKDGAADVKADHGSWDDDDDDVVPFDEIPFKESHEPIPRRNVGDTPRKRGLPSEFKRSRSLRRRSRK